jgi:hypothetical protein
MKKTVLEKIARRVIAVGLSAMMAGAFALMPALAPVRVMAAAMGQQGQLPNPDTTIFMQNAATATGNGTAVFVRFYGGAQIQVSGTFSATVTFEHSLDNSNWTLISGFDLSARTYASSATAAGAWFFTTPGSEYIRARISAYVSGSVTAVCRPVPQPVSTGISSYAQGAPNSLANAWPVQLSNGTIAQPVGTTTASLNFTSPASATTVAQTPVTGLGPYRSMIVFANIQGGTGGTLDIYIQFSPDSGTTWVDYAHFAQLAAGAAAITRMFAVSKSGQQTTLQTVGTGTSPALAASTIVGGDWGDRLRVVAVAGASTSAGAAQVISLILTA